jgi:hypothetical protein
MQYLIENAQWTQISSPGRNVTIRLSEEGAGNKGHADIRVVSSVSQPAADETTLSHAKKVYTPGGNADCLFLSPADRLASFWARAARVNDAAILISEYDGIGQPVKLDVSIQDQYTKVVDKFVTRKLGTATLAAPTAVDARTITLEAGHGFANGSMIEIDDGNNCYQSRVITVATNLLTVTNPVHHAFSVASAVRRVSPDLNVDGSVEPIHFTFVPPENVECDINILSINMLDDVAMDDGKFGGITAIANGVVFRTINSHIMPIFTAVDNGCFRRHCDTDQPYSDKAPAGIYGLNVKRHFNGQNGDGVARRIGKGGSFDVIVQDDLRALSRFWVVVRGHQVED